MVATWILYDTPSDDDDDGGDLDSGNAPTDASKTTHLSGGEHHGNNELLPGQNACHDQEHHSHHNDTTSFGNTDFQSYEAQPTSDAQYRLSDHAMYLYDTPSDDDDGGDLDSGQNEDCGCIIAVTPLESAASSIDGCGNVPPDEKQIRGVSRGDNLKDDDTQTMWKTVSMDTQCVMDVETDGNKMDHADCITNVRCSRRNLEEKKDMKLVEKYLGKELASFCMVNGIVRNDNNNVKHDNTKCKKPIRAIEEDLYKIDRYIKNTVREIKNSLDCNASNACFVSIDKKDKKNAQIHSTKLKKNISDINKDLDSMNEFIEQNILDFKKEIKSNKIDCITNVKSSTKKLKKRKSLVVSWTSTMCKVLRKEYA